LIEQTNARPERLIQAAAQAADWSRFVPSITKSQAAAPKDGTPMAELEQSVPLLSFRTTYAVQTTNNAVDLFGTAGDLRGGRLRFDLRPGRADKTQLVLRAAQSFDRNSILIRQLYKLEPLFEYGVNVGLSLVIHRGVKLQGEKLTQAANVSGRPANPQ
jgi:hypothetical protein